MAEDGINISDMGNRSRRAYAYTMPDMDQPASDALVAHLEKIEGVLRVRKIK